MNRMTIDYFEGDIKSYILDLDRSDITKQSYKAILMKFSLYLRERFLEVPKSRNIIEYKEMLIKEFITSDGAKNHRSFKRVLQISCEK